ncbi:MAG: hypothetical protein GF317_09975 [Candidatus Lokiarchaeota archaeon]|nr:hypothetical protein [Candidatus Lokiarchaeota archaeon]MBD3200003.1 hypothetical protein [Candidatus Lokiarchaeota archaeon]
MREIEEIGDCPKCECSIMMYKTSSYKRFAKCEICGNSYPLPKRGNIEETGKKCPVRSFPLLLVQKGNRKAYFWTDRPCFTCQYIDKCKVVKELQEEFKDLKVYGYG